MKYFPIHAGEELAEVRLQKVRGARPSKPRLHVSYAGMRAHSWAARKGAWQQGGLEDWTDDVHKRVLREAKRQLGLQRPDLRIAGEELHPMLRIKDFAPYMAKIKASGADAIVPSFSSRTIVYKGMLTADQLETMFPDLADEGVESALALVHQRFSTNTFPSWPLAHPYRLIAHNGEINTLRGNVNWMKARQSLFESDLFGDDIKKILPVVNTDGSDSGMFDNSLELLYLAGRSLPASSRPARLRARIRAAMMTSNIKQRPIRSMFSNCRSSIRHPLLRILWKSSICHRWL